MSFRKKLSRWGGAAAAAASADAEEGEILSPSAGGGGGGGKEDGEIESPPSSSRPVAMPQSNEPPNRINIPPRSTAAGTPGSYSAMAASIPPPRITSNTTNNTTPYGRFDGPPQPPGTAEPSPAGGPPRGVVGVGPPPTRAEHNAGGGPRGDNALGGGGHNLNFPRRPARFDRYERGPSWRGRGGVMGNSVRRGGSGRTLQQQQQQQSQQQQQQQQDRDTSPLGVYGPRGASPGGGLHVGGGQISGVDRPPPPQHGSAGVPHSGGPPHGGSPHGGPPPAAGIPRNKSTGGLPGRPNVGIGGGGMRRAGTYSGPASSGNDPGNYYGPSGSSDPGPPPPLPPPPPPPPPPRTPSGGKGSMSAAASSSSVDTSYYGPSAPSPELPRRKQVSAEAASLPKKLTSADLLAIPPATDRPSHVRTPSGGAGGGPGSHGRTHSGGVPSHVRIHSGGRGLSSRESSSRSLLEGMPPSREPSNREPSNRSLVDGMPPHREGSSRSLLGGPPQQQQDTSKPPVSSSSLSSLSHLLPPLHHRPDEPPPFPPRRHEPPPPSSSWRRPPPMVGSPRRQGSDWSFGSGASPAANSKSAMTPDSRASPGNSGNRSGGKPLLSMAMGEQAPAPPFAVQPAAAEEAPKPEVVTPRAPVVMEKPPRAPVVVEKPPASAAKPVKKKKEDHKKKLSPLTVAALGNSEKVVKAKKAVQKLNELVSKPSVQPSSGEGAVLLPTKLTIMKGLSDIEKKIKNRQDAETKISAEIESAIQKEEVEQKRMEKERQERERAERERLEQEAEEKRREAERQEEQRRKIEQEAELAATKRIQEELEKRLEEHKARERQQLEEALKEELQSVMESHATSISSAQAELDQAEQLVSELKRKASVMEAAAPAAEEEARERAKKKMRESELYNEVGAVDEDVAQRQGNWMNDLISTVLAENRRRAAEAQMECLSLIPYTPVSSKTGDSDGSNCSDKDDDDAKIQGKTVEEWANAARQVTGPENALYREPSDNPCFKYHEEQHAIIRPLVLEHVRAKKKKLRKRWEEMAEEFYVRKQIYIESMEAHEPEKQTQEESNALGTKTALSEYAGGRAGSNPYRRARRGNFPMQAGLGGDVVRSEYEQEQIIAELTKKDAMEKRIKHGGSKLPRQRCQLENELFVTYEDTLSSRLVDMMKEKEELAKMNLWTDMEKCIFFDRFLQYPKDFRRIASFLRNKTTKDCVAFYYNSKQSVPYKAALKEHLMRRRRRTDASAWEATIQAAISVGGVITAGPSVEKPLIFSLPKDDNAYTTLDFHPMKREVFDAMQVDESAENLDLEAQLERSSASKKGPPFNMFSLAESERRFLRSTSTDSFAGLKRKADDGSQVESTKVSRSSSHSALQEAGKTGETSSRRVPQKWTQEEKKIFFDTLIEHGRVWKKLEAALPSKTQNQIKNYYYDHKKQKQLGKHIQQSQHQQQTSTVKTSTEAAKSSRSTSGGSTKGRTFQPQQSPVSEESNQSMTPVDHSINAVSTAQYAREDSREMTVEDAAAGDIYPHEAAAMASRAADLWAQQQLQQHHQQQQHQQQQHAARIAAEANRRMLQPHPAAHQQVINSVLPWMVAQAAALQQQQQQQPEHAQPGNMGASHASVRDYIDAATLQANVLALRQAQAAGLGSHIRQMAMAGLLSGGNSHLMQQLENTSEAESQLHEALLRQGAIGLLARQAAPRSDSATPRTSSGTSTPHSYLPERSGAPPPPKPDGSDQQQPPPSY